MAFWNEESQFRHFKFLIWGSEGAGKSTFLQSLEAELTLGARTHILAGQDLAQFETPHTSRFLVKHLRLQVDMGGHPAFVSLFVVPSQINPSALTHFERFLVSNSDASVFVWHGKSPDESEACFQRFQLCAEIFDFELAQRNTVVVVNRFGLMSAGWAARNFLNHKYDDLSLFETNLNVDFQAKDAFSLLKQNLEESVKIPEQQGFQLPKHPPAVFQLPTKQSRPVS